MEYKSQEELYLALLPAFSVKRRLNSITKYPNIKNSDIWKYLTLSKWKNSIGLTLADMVNDIIMVDVSDINHFIGGKQWEKEN